MRGYVKPNLEEAELRKIEVEFYTLFHIILTSNTIMLSKTKMYPRLKLFKLNNG